MRSITLIILGLLLLAGCTTDIDTCTGNTCRVEVNMSENETDDITVDKLEVYHFHGTNQCYSCITVGDYAEETVKTHFQDEVESGKILFDHINADLPENRDLVQKYGATGSSLWLGTYQNGSFEAEQNTKVWYKIRDKQDYMDYLKSVIEQKLAGD